MADQIEIPKPNINQKENALIRTSSMSNIKQNMPEKTGKTIKGSATKKPLTFGEKLKRAFVKEDAKDISDYILFDIVIPGAKYALFDTLVGIASQTLGIPVSEANRNFRNRTGRSSVGVSERPFRDYAAQSRLGNVDRSTRSLNYDRYRVTDVIFDYKEDALSLLEQMADICDQNGWFSVATFYDRAGIKEGTVHTNYNYGWHNVDGATVESGGGGYFINLPPARMR